MEAILLRGGRCFVRFAPDRSRFHGVRFRAEPVVEAGPENVVLIILPRCIALSGAIEEKLINAAEIDIEIFRPREPMIAQGIFEAGAEHIFRTGGVRCSSGKIIAGSGRVESDRTWIAIATICDARRRIEYGAIESISEAGADSPEIMRAAAGKTIGANTELHIGRRSGECAIAAIAEIVQVRFEAGYERADLVIVTGLETAGEARFRPAGIRDKVEASRRKANRSIAGIGRSKPSARIRAQIEPGPSEYGRRRGEVRRESGGRQTGGCSDKVGRSPSQPILRH
jgi:hypothetical protein